MDPRRLSIGTYLEFPFISYSLPMGVKFGRLLDIFMCSGKLIAFSWKTVNKIMRIINSAGFLDYKLVNHTS